MKESKKPKSIKGYYYPSQPILCGIVIGHIVEFLFNGINWYIIFTDSSSRLFAIKAVDCKPLHEYWKY